MSTNCCFLVFLKQEKSHINCNNDKHKISSFLPIYIFTKGDFTEYKNTLLIKEGTDQQDPMSRSSIQSQVSHSKSEENHFSQKLAYFSCFLGMPLTERNSSALPGN